MSGIGFNVWLKGQINRSDGVGDLARFAIDDLHWPRHFNTSDPGPIYAKCKMYLDDLMRPQSDIKALRQAVEEYRAFCEWRAASKRERLAIVVMTDVETL